MKANAILAFPFVVFFSLNLFGQVKDTSEISIKFLNSKENSTQYIDKDGTNRVKLPFTVKRKKDITPTKDYFVKVSIDHITTDKKDFKIINSIIPVSKEDLNQSDSLFFIEIEIFPHTVDKIAEVFKLKLNCESVVFNEKDHSCAITLLPKTSLTIEQKAKEQYKSELLATDTIDFAFVNLSTKNGLINIYSKGSAKIDTNCRENCSKKRFVKRYEKRKAKSDEKRYEKRKAKSDEKRYEKRFKKCLENCSKKRNLVFPIEVENLEIEKVILHVENGRFAKVTIFPKFNSGVYVSKYPFSATKYGSVKQRIFYEGSEASLDGSYINLSEILEYNELTSRSRFPPNETIILTPENPEKKIVFVRNPVEFFDARFYTDPLGLKGSPNGLVQTQIGAHLFLNTLNHKHSTWFSDLHILYDWSKFDSKFDTLAVQSFVDRTPTDLLSIRKQANMNLDIKLDVLRVSNVHTFTFGVGHFLSLTRSADTTGAFNNIISPAVTAYITGFIEPNPWIDFRFHLPFYVYYNYDQVFSNYKNKFDFVIAPEIEMRIKPAGFSKSNKSVSGTSFFARVRYFDMTSYRGGNFLQIQTGVSFSLSKFLN